MNEGGIPTDTEMHILVTDKMQRAPNVENEADALQALANLEYLAIDSACGEVLKSRTFSEPCGICRKIEESNKMEELSMGIGGDAQESEGEKKEIDRREFKEAWRKGLVDWGSEKEILAKGVDNYHEVGNYEPEEEKKVNNAIAGEVS